MATTVVPGMTAMRNLAAALLVSLLALPSWTQAAEDPPDRVARLSLLEGDVSMAPAGTQEWGEAVLNRPLTSEDRLFVDRDSRAELQVGSATIHLDASTEFSFIELADDAMTMHLTGGRATVRILTKRDREDIEINTPNASVALLHPGEYHIEVDEDGETTVVKARSGEAEVAGEGDSFTVRSNEIGTFRGTDTLTADISRLGPRTAFESWANDRARRNERSASSKYVSEGVVGYEDLDEHGHWAHEPEYGYVWTPRYVVAGWAPYRYGRWVWVSPWGWTWIDDARWGFAPFHYGRWTYVRHRWCWVPGPRHVRAVYAPALVAWVGGPHISVNVSLGHGVGWFPLGPREVYVPGYWHTRRYIHRVNVSNTIIVNNTYIDRAYRGGYRDFGYRYRDRPDAVTIVDREHFVRGRPIGNRVVRVDEGQLRRWGHDARPPAIAPERESILAGQARTPRGFTANNGSHRQVVARRELPRRVSFDDERRAIEANGGRPVARTALVDRNPKERADVRIARGRVFEAGGRNDIERSSTAAREPTVERMRAVEDERRDVRPQRDEVRSQSGISRDRESGGSAPSINPSDAPKSYTRRERNSSDAVTERRQFEQQREAARDSRRDWPSQRSEPRIEQRSERTFSPEPRSQPRIERAPAPRVERSYSQPRVERSYSQPERQSQPRMERSPQPRSESRSHSSPKEGRSSSHSRMERGGGRER